MSQETTFCARCGGVKAMFVKFEPYVANNYITNNCLPSPTMIYNNAICMCPPIVNAVPSLREEPEQPKHDGKLDEYSDGWGNSHAQVELEGKGIPHGMGHATTGMPPVHVEGGYGGIEMEDVFLDAKQALSLLKWLQQNRERLEQLAKEQEG